MKKLLAGFMCLALSAFMAGCAGDSKVKETVEEKESQAETSEVVLEVAETSKESSGTHLSSSSTTLVVYFSRTGNTEVLAEYVADYCNADVFEIIAAEPYSDEDIDYNNSGSRASKEQNDTSVRPAIADEVTNMDQYTTIILAYPVWFGQAPRIIDTFMESYDFSNKTIIPFCTSASSDIGTSDEYLHGLTSSSVNWVKGKRFAPGTDEETIISWIEGYFY